MFRLPEVKHHQNAAKPENDINTGYVDLTFNVSWKFDLHFGPEVHADCFAYESERSANQRLARYDSCHCCNEDSRQQKPMRHDGIERIYC